MQLDRKEALRVWEMCFGKTVEATDFSGRGINKSAYNQKNSRFGWEVTSVVPVSEGGRDNDANRIVAHTQTVAEKGDAYPTFKANGKRYTVTEGEEGLKIEIASDSESIAEQEAITAAAMEKWDLFFGAEYDKAKDFCGRIIHKAEFCTDSEFSWKVAKYVEDKPAEYIANAKSVDEAFGRTAFTANGSLYSLHRENGGYFFKYNEPKPKAEQEQPTPQLAIKPKFMKGITLRLKRPEQEIPAPQLAIKPKFMKGITLRLKREEPKPEPAEKPFDVTDPMDVALAIQNAMIGAVNGAETEMLDFIVLRVVAKPGCPASFAGAIVDTVSRILKGGAGEWLAMESTDMVDERGARHMVIAYRFATPTPAELEKVFGAAKILNTYSSLLLQTLGVESLKIFNYAAQINRTQTYYPLGHLMAYNPELKALMDGVYAGYYDQFSFGATSLFVSRFICFNIAELREAHPDGIAEFLPPVGMIEHNAHDFGVDMALGAMMSGGSTSSEEVKQDEAPSEPTVAPVTEETAAEAEETEKEEAPACEPSIAPVDEETATAKEEAEAEDEAPFEPSIAPVAEEAATDEEEAEAEDEVPCEPSIAPVDEETPVSDMAEKLSGVLAEALATADTEKEPSVTTEKPIVIEQLKLDLEKASETEAAEEEATDEDGDKKDGGEDDDDIVTIDLDMIF